MPGKFTPQRGKLRQYVPEDASYNERLEVKKAEVAPLGKPGLAKLIKRMNERKKKLAEIEKKIHLNLDAAGRLLVEMLFAAEEEKFSIADGGSFFLNDKIRVRCVDPRAQYEWALENGYINDLVIHPKKLESIVGDMLLEGQDPPPWIEVYIDTVIGTRGASDKAA